MLIAGNVIFNSLTTDGRSRRLHRQTDAATESGLQELQVVPRQRLPREVHSG